MKFIILGPSRSGSSLLGSSIDQHPHVTCGLEILHPEAETRKRHAKSINCGLRMDPQSINLEAEIRQFFNHYQTQSVGFKQVYEHIRLFNQWKLLATLQDTAIIQIKRNPIACLISHRQAVLSGKWHLTLDENIPAEIPKFPLTSAEVCVWIDHINECEKKIESLENDRLSITYQEIAQDFDRCMAKVFGYLGVEFMSVKPQRQKLGRKNPTICVEDWDLLKGELRHSYSDFLIDII